MPNKPEQRLVSQDAREAAGKIAEVVLEHISTGTGPCMETCFTDTFAQFEALIRNKVIEEAAGVADRMRANAEAKAQERAVDPEAGSVDNAIIASMAFETVASAIRKLGERVE